MLMAFLAVACFFCSGYQPLIRNVVFSTRRLNSNCGIVLLGFIIEVFFSVFGVLCGFCFFSIYFYFRFYLKFI